jgi:hypothetical protein
MKKNKATGTPIMYSKKPKIVTNIEIMSENVAMCNSFKPRFHSPGNNWYHSPLKHCVWGLLSNKYVPEYSQQ